MTFGAKISVPKIRASSNMSIIWRMRLTKMIVSKRCMLIPLTLSSHVFAICIRLRMETNNGNIEKELVPIRPCVSLAGAIDLQEGEALQLL